MENNHHLIKNVPSIAALDRELVKRKGLKEFVRLAWPIIEPSEPLVWNWHLDAICDHVQAMYKGELLRILITVPPGTMKSLICSVFAPAWSWTWKPEEKSLFCSYSETLSMRDSLRTRRIIESNWYKERWGGLFQLRDDQNTKTKFENTQTGIRITTSVGGTVTGERGNNITCDDLLSAQNAESPAYRKEASNFFWEVLPSRFNDLRTGRMCVIMQRLHSSDPAGEILEKEKNKLLEDRRWEHLNLPLEYEPTTHVTSLGFKDPRTVEGESLHPERFTAKVIAQLKEDLGSYAYNGQYQQRPIPREGGLIKESWLRTRFSEKYLTYENLIKKKPFLIVQSADCASKAKEHNDPTVIGTFAVFKDQKNYWAECWDVFRKRVEFPEGIRRFKDLGAAWQPNFVLIEDKDSGQQYSQQLQEDQDYKFKIIKMDPEGLDKFTRMSAESTFIEKGNLHLPETAPFNASYITELTTFPSSDHDDQVDMTSQFLKWLRRLIKQSYQVVAPLHEASPSRHIIS